MALARSFASAIRREDTCARWGGEEFLFLLPEASAGEAEAMARKLLEAARSLAVPYRGALLRCTLSAGVAPFRPGASLDDILRGADAALYRAKHGGKDRVESELLGAKPS
jgi:diguanylate cyclase (GGDEF)-like protein